MRNGEAKFLSGFKIDHQLVLGRRLHWKVTRLLALEDAVDIASRSPELVNVVGPIRDQDIRLLHTRANVLRLRKLVVRCPPADASVL